jgi:hypothetical protein
MKFEDSNDRTTFSLGELTTAEQFHDAIPMARTVPAGFPVLTTTLGFHEFESLEAQADSVASLLLEVVPHPTVSLLKLTFTAGEFRVHWLADEQAPELKSAIHVWREAGEAAFAMLLPEATRTNCVFGKIRLVAPPEMQNRACIPRNLESVDGWDVMRAIVETGDTLQNVDLDGFNDSEHCEVTTILLTNRVRLVANELSETTVTLEAVKRASVTVH